MKKSSLTPEEEITVKSYDLLGTEWATDHDDKDYWKNELEIFKKYLPKGKVLEIGSGGGRDAQNLFEAGFDYIGTDVSGTLLEVARKNNPSLTFFQKSVYDLDFPNNTFDGFWTAATLLHIPKSRIDEALQSIHRVIKNNGVGFISVKQGSDEAVSSGDEDFGDQFKRLFSLYSLEEFSKHLLENNYDILEIQTRAHGSKTVWLCYFVKVKFGDNLAEKILQLEG